jgi:hypothetical protein
VAARPFLLTLILALLPFIVLGGWALQSSYEAESELARRGVPITGAVAEVGGPEGKCDTHIIRIRVPVPPAQPLTMTQCADGTASVGDPVVFYWIKGQPGSVKDELPTQDETDGGALLFSLPLLGASAVVLYGLIQLTRQSRGRELRPISLTLRGS